jgi:hypothetical protein
VIKTCHQFGGEYWEMTTSYLLKKLASENALEENGKRSWVIQILA